MASAGQAIKELITQMLNGAQITSAREDWINHVFSLESDPGLVKAIDEQIGTKTTTALRTPAQVEKRFRDFMKSIEPAAKGAASGTLASLLVQHLGVVQARNAMMMLANPQKAIAGVITSKKLFQGINIGAKVAGIGKMSPGTMMKAGGIIALILLVINSRAFIERITQMMTKRGGIFDKTFRNKTNTLQNILRNREQQQSIRSGFTQVIFTTNAGTTDPRDAYNTYEQTVHDEIRLTNLRNIRSVGNVVP